VWRKYVDDEGDAYYHNSETQETTWERPAGFLDPEEKAEVATDKLLQAGADLDALLDGGNRRVLVISSAVVKLQSQLILSAAREDVTVVLFDDGATSPSTLAGMIQAAVPRGGRLAMLGFMTQSSAAPAVAADGTAVVELVRGQSEQTSRRSLRSDETLKQFWRDVGALIQDGGHIDLLKSTIGRASDSAWLLADLEQLANCAVTAEESLVESSGENYFDMANLSLLIRGSVATPSSAAAGPPFTSLAPGSGYPAAEREPPSSLLQRERILPGSGERAYPLTVPPSGGNTYGQQPSALPSSSTAGEVSPARCSWRRYYDEDGDAYYVNVDTGETTWSMPPQFVDPPNEQRAIAERRAQSTVATQEQTRIMEEHQRVLRQEMSDQAAADRRAVQEALAQVEQLSRASAETLALAKAKAEEAATASLTQQQQQQQQLAGPEESPDDEDGATDSASVLAAKAADMLTKERARRVEEIEREKSERSFFELQASQALAREKMEKAAAELRASEEAQAKVEAEAELAKMRQRMEELERHVAEESTAKTAAQESAVAAKQEAADKTAAAEQGAADREARAADREAEAAEAQAEAAALAARISGLVEESINPSPTVGNRTSTQAGSDSPIAAPSPRRALVQYNDAQGQPYLIDTETGERMAPDGSALVAPTPAPDGRFEEGHWSEIVGRAEQWQDIVVSAEERAHMHANRTTAEQMTELMRETEREKLDAIAEIERKEEALREQIETAAEEERQRREAAETLAQEWRGKAEDAEKALQAAAEAEAAATEELQRQRETAEQEASQEGAAAAQEAVDRALKAEAAEQSAKEEARAAQAKFVEHQNRLEREQRTRKDLEEQVKFEIEASRAAEEARTATQWELAKARELLKKQEGSTNEQQQAAAAAEAKLEEEKKLAESIKSQAETVRANMDVERRRLAEVAEVAAREAAEQDRSSAMDREARVIAEEGLVEEQKRRQEAEARARETEWALEKAEQLLRAHEETADFYMAKARDEAVKASQAQTQSLHAGHLAAEMSQAAHLAAVGQLTAQTQSADALTAARAFQAQAQAQSRAAEAREAALNQQVSYAVEEISTAAILSAEEVKRAAEQAATHAAASTLPSGDETAGSPVDRVMRELGKFHNALEESDAKINAALAARESAESSAKSATDQAMSQAQQATQMVDTLSDELAKTREAQESHQSQVAELVTVRAQAEERNAEMVRQLADAQRRLEEAMGGGGGGGGGAGGGAVRATAVAAANPVMEGALVADTVGHGQSASDDVKSGPGGAAAAAPPLSKEDALLAALSSHDSGELQRKLRQKENELKGRRQSLVEKYYQKQQWFIDMDQNPRSPWNGGSVADLRTHVASNLGQGPSSIAQAAAAGTAPGVGGGLRESFRAGVESVANVAVSTAGAVTGGVAGGGRQQQQGGTAPLAEAPGGSGSPGPGGGAGEAPPPPAWAAGGSSDSADEPPPPPPPPPGSSSDDDGPPPPPPPPPSQPAPQMQQLGMPPAHAGALTAASQGVPPPAAPAPAAAPAAPAGNRERDAGQKAALLSWVDGYCGARGVASCNSFGHSFNDGVAFCAVLAGANLLDWGMVAMPANNHRARKQVRPAPAAQHRAACTDRRKHTP
jgi:hypothetical protein